MGQCVSRPTEWRARAGQAPGGQRELIAARQDGKANTTDAIADAAADAEQGRSKPAALPPPPPPLPEVSPQSNDATQPRAIPASCGRCTSDAVQGLQEPAGAPWDYQVLGIPSPPNEHQRTATHTALGLLNAPHSDELDMLLDLVSRVFDAPYVSLALYFNRQCWLANAKHISPGPQPWKIAACPWSSMSTQPNTIACGDLMEDARYHHLPWVGDGLRCYCSAPLLAANGHRLGTICFSDTLPRKVDVGMCRVLNNFGELAVRILERHIGLAKRLAAAQPDGVTPVLGSLIHAAREGRPLPTRSSSHRSLVKGPDEGYWGGSSGGGGIVAGSPEDTLLASLFERQLRSPEVARDACVLIIDTSQPGWPVLWADDTWAMWSGFPRSELLGRGLWETVRSGTNGVAPINWESLQAQADATERFVVPGVVAAVPGSRHASGSIGSILPAGPNALQSEPDHAWAHKPGSGRFGTMSSRVQDLDISPGPSPGTTPSAGPMVKADSEPPSRPVGGSASQTMVPRAAPVPSAISAPLRPPSAQRDGELSAAPPEARLFPIAPPARDLKNWAGEPAPEGDSSRSGIMPVSHLMSQSALGTSRAFSAGTEALFAHVAGMEHDTRSSMDIKRHENAAAQGVQLGHAAAGGMYSVSRSTVGSKSTAGAAAPQRLIDLSFRPLALDLLDSDTLPIGVPNWVELKALAPMLRLYAVRLHDAGSVPPPLQPLTPSMKVLHNKAGGLQALAAHMFPGLKVGTVLGSGGYGTAYLGTWHDAPVVVKAQDYSLNDLQDLRQAQLEVSLGQLLRHPNLVRTLGHGSAEVPRELGGGPEGRPVPHHACAPAPAQAQPPVPTSRTFHASIPTWAFDDEDGLFSDSKWFSHCSAADMMARDLTAHMAPSVLASMPSAPHLVNSVSLGPELRAVAGSVAAAAPVPAASRVPLDNITEEVTAEGVALMSLAAALQDSNAAGGSALQPPQRHTMFGTLAAAQAANSGTTSLSDNGAVAPPATSGDPPPEPRLTASSLDGEALPEVVYVPVGMHNVRGSVVLPTSQRKDSHSFTSFVHMSPSPSTPTYASRRPTAFSAFPRLPFWDATGPASSGAVSQGSWGTMAGLSRMWSGTGGGPSSTDFPVSDELRLMLATSELQAEAVKAEPLTFPLRLRTLAVQELCDGGTLQDAVDRGWLRLGEPCITSPPDLGKIARLGMDIARGCAYVHSRGVVHADLSASNVLLCRQRPTVPEGQAVQLAPARDDSSPLSSETAATTSQGGRASSGGAGSSSSAAAHTTPALYYGMTAPEQEDKGFRLPIRSYTLAPQQPRQGQDWQFVAKVADFGRSRLLSAEGVADAGGYATITHMAPEVLRDSLLTPAADVYALGVLLWQMYTGARPWAGLGHRQIIGIVRSGAAQLEWTRHAALPETAGPAAEALTAVGMSCLNADAAQRPTMAQAYDALAEVLELLQGGV